MPNLKYNFGDQKFTIFIAKIIKFHPDLWVFSMKKISSGHNNKMGANDDGKVKTYNVCESEKSEKFMG